MCDTDNVSIRAYPDKEIVTKGSAMTHLEMLTPSPLTFEEGEGGPGQVARGIFDSKGGLCYRTEL